MFYAIFEDNNTTIAAAFDTREQRAKWCDDMNAGPRAWHEPDTAYCCNEASYREALADGALTLGQAEEQWEEAALCEMEAQEWRQ